jgi:hypothetical protein
VIYLLSEKCCKSVAFGKYEKIGADDEQVQGDHDFKVTEISIPVPNKDDAGTTPVSFFFRDVSSCIEEILNSPAVRAAGIVLESTEDTDAEGRRVFSALHNSNQFLHFQKSLRIRTASGKVIFLILYSDETSKRSGGMNGQQYYPLLLALGNTPVHVRNLDASKSLVGLLPVKQDGMSALEHVRLVHKCLGVVVEQIRELHNSGIALDVPVFQSSDATLVEGPLPAKRRQIIGYPYMGMHCGDWKERCRIGCVAGYWKGRRPCPCCYVKGEHQHRVRKEDHDTILSTDPDQATFGGYDVANGCESDSTTDCSSSSEEDGEEAGEEGAGEGADERAQGDISSDPLSGDETGGSSGADADGSDEEDAAGNIIELRFRTSAESRRLVEEQFAAVEAGERSELQAIKALKVRVVVSQCVCVVSSSGQKAYWRHPNRNSLLSCSGAWPPTCTECILAAAWFAS